MAESRQFAEIAGRIRGWRGTVRPPLAHLFSRANAREIESVRWFTKHLQVPGVTTFALVVNRLANGSLYVLVGALFWLAYGMWAAVAAAAFAMAFGHVLYPIIKRRCRRRRPFRFDPSVPSLLEPLDNYSFPSGHVMSCVAVLIPLCVAVPALLPWTLLLLLVVAWGRLVAGHHYPSDLFAGGLLGVTVALPVVAVQIGYG